MKSHVLNVILSDILNVILNVIFNAEISGTWLEVIQYWFWYYLPNKSLVVVVVGGDRQNLVLSPGPGLWSMVLGPGPGPELDNRRQNIKIMWNHSDGAGKKVSRISKDPSSSSGFSELSDDSHNTIECQSIDLETKVCKKRFCLNVCASPFILSVKYRTIYFNSQLQFLTGGMTLAWVTISTQRATGTS